MIVDEMIQWLQSAAAQMQNESVRKVLHEASRMMAYQKQTLEAVTMSNNVLAQKLNSYLEPEQEGRLYVFPCKPGDKVYAISTCVGIMDVNGGAEEFTDCPFEGKCPHCFPVGCGEEPNTKAVFADTVTHLIADKDGIGFSTEHCGGFTVDQIGETVFFDRTQAEQKLEEIKNGKAD